MSISLSINQAEAPSHVQAVCFGRGALKWADVICARMPQRPRVRESMITSFPTVPFHVVNAVLTVINHQCNMIELWLYVTKTSTHN